MGERIDSIEGIEPIEGIEGIGGTLGLSPPGFLAGLYLRGSCRGLGFGLVVVAGVGVGGAEDGDAGGGIGGVEAVPEDLLAAKVVLEDGVDAVVGGSFLAGGHLVATCELGATVDVAEEVILAVVELGDDYDILVVDVGHEADGCALEAGVEEFEGAFPGAASGDVALLCVLEFAHFVGGVDLDEAFAGLAGDGLTGEGGGTDGDEVVEGGWVGDVGGVDGEDVLDGAEVGGFHAGLVVVARVELVEAVEGYVVAIHDFFFLDLIDK